MHRKAFSIFLTLAFVAGLVGVSTTAALADNDGNTVTSLLPDDDCSPNCNGWQLSDRPDGTDSLAHLTAVVPQDTTHVDWVLCPTSVDFPLTQAEVTSCDVPIGSDTTPKTPAAGSLFSAADEAYDVKWNIPIDQDQQIRDVAVLACIGEGQDVEDPGRNCRTNLEENIQLEDSSGGGVGSTQSSAGEMFAICTGDVTSNGTTGPRDGVTHGNEPCQYDTDETATAGTPEAPAGASGNGVTTSTERAEVDALFKPWEHGDPIPNNGFVLRATTSPDTTTLQAIRQFDPPVTSSVDMDDADESWACSIIKVSTSANTFECAFADQGSGANSDDNVSQGVQIYGGTEGSCNSCVMDAHWTASSDRAAATLVSTFEPEADGSPAPATSCTSPDKEETNPLGAQHDLRVCLTDQFGDPFTGDVTFESAGVGGFASTGSGPGDCTLHDHDQNQLFEHCHLTAGDFAANGQTNNVWIANTTTPGDQTITVCAEGEPGSAVAGSGNPAPAGHGCSDETVKDTLVKHWIATPQHVHLVFQGTGTAEDPCHTGDTTKENLVGDTEDLLVCTQSLGHVPATTNQTNGGRLQWRIASGDPGGVVATRFVGQPPSETGADGTATVQIEAFRPGNDLISVSLTDDTGTILQTVNVQKRVTGQTTPACSDSFDNDNDGKTDFPNDPGCDNANDTDEQDTAPTGRDTESNTTVTIRFNNGSFKGQVQNSKARCVRGRLVVLKKVRRGPDKTVGRDTANRSGNWSVRKPSANGRYYAKAGQTSFTKGNGFRHTCLADKSVTIRVQR